MERGIEAGSDWAGSDWAGALARLAGMTPGGEIGCSDDQADGV